MVSKLYFLYHIIPYELFPLEYPDQSQKEEYIFRLFVSRVYEWIVEDGNHAIFAALKFWATMNDYERDACSIRMMPLPIVLTEFADSIGDKELIGILNNNEYNISYYHKLFKIQ